MDKAVCKDHYRPVVINWGQFFLLYLGHGQCLETFLLLLSQYGQGKFNWNLEDRSQGADHTLRKPYSKELSTVSLVLTFRNPALN